MTSQSAMADYISIILRAIEKAQNDPSQLRQLVYDISRISVGQQLLINYRELSGEGLQQQISDLESAIRQVETLARLENELLPTSPRVALIASSTTIYDDVAAVVNHRAGRTGESGDQQLLTTLNPNHELQPAMARSDVVQSGQAPNCNSADRFWKIELLIAIILGFAIYAVTLTRWDSFPMQDILGHREIARGPAAPTTSVLAARPTSTNSTFARTNNSHPMGFPLPSVYGVYATSGGKLYALDPLAMRVPDPRVAVSAMISSMSRMVIPNGQIKFIIYRRDLSASAPDNVSVRVVAQVMREIKFTGSGPPKTVSVDGQWAIRNKSYNFEVAPIENNPEMIVVRPTDANFRFLPGRYALVFKGEGYDFSVAGKVSDIAHCLDRTDALGGMVYSECRRLP